MSELSPVSGLEVLVGRAREGFDRTKDDDGHSVVLSVDGGGMAGELPLGGIRVLQQEGLFDKFNGYYGVSSGALDVAYAAAEQTETAIEIYVEAMPGISFMPANNRQVVRAYLGGRPSEQIEGLARVVGSNASPYKLDTDVVREATVPVVANLTVMPKFSTRRIDLRKLDNHAEIIKTLVRGASIPLVGTPYPLSAEGNEWLIDGGVAIKTTEELATPEATHIVSLACRPYSPWKRGAGKKLADILLGGVLARDFHDLSLIGKYYQFGSEQAKLLGPITEEPFQLDGARVDKIYPAASSDLPGRGCMDKEKLRAGVRAGELAMQKALALVHK